jgi:hypothetical protein
MDMVFRGESLASCAWRGFPGFPRDGNLWGKVSLGMQELDQGTKFVQVSCCYACLPDPHKHLAYYLTLQIFERQLLSRKI